jgi:Arc/MetJ family transcription regulator
VNIPYLLRPWWEEVGRRGISIVYRWPTGPSRVFLKALTYMHKMCIYIHMRTTININDEILKKASEITGIKEKTRLVRLGLEALIALESSKRLAKLGGTEKELNPISRRKPSP